MRQHRLLLQRPLLLLLLLLLDLLSLLNLLLLLLLHLLLTQSLQVSADPPAAASAAAPAPYYAGHAQPLQRLLLPAALHRARAQQSAALLLLRVRPAGLIAAAWGWLVAAGSRESLLLSSARGARCGSGDLLEGGVQAGTRCHTRDPSSSCC
jgi:hypothetical protein